METVLLAGMLGLAGALLLVAVNGRRTQRELAQSRAQVEQLGALVAASGPEPPAPSTSAPAAVPSESSEPAEPAMSSQSPQSPQSAEPARAEYLITSVGVSAAGAPPSRDSAAEVSGRQFVSLAAGESLVRLASLAYGVRRALSAESRNRIGFEVRREVKRARSQRRRDLKEARRTLRAEQRARMDAA